jgi:hypothetical protein
MAQVQSDKKKCNVITVDTKLDIIKRFDNGQSKANINRAQGLNEFRFNTTILPISNEYTEQGRVALASFSIQCTRNRGSILIEMEYLLIIWLEECNKKRIPIGTNDITVKAFSLFSSLTENKFKTDTTINSASRGWFQIF